MNNFLKVCTPFGPEYIVSARELHARLGSDRDFTSWFKYQVESLKLVEGVNYTEFTTKNVGNSGLNRKRGRPAKDYAITEDTVMSISGQSSIIGAPMTKEMANRLTKKQTPLSRLEVLALAKEIVRQADENETNYEKRVL